MNRTLRENAGALALALAVYTAIPWMRSNHLKDKSAAYHTLSR